MWYVVDCEENSFVYYGLNKDTTKEEIQQKVKIKGESLVIILNM